MDKEDAEADAPVPMQYMMLRLLIMSLLFVMLRYGARCCGVQKMQGQLEKIQGQLGAEAEGE